MAAEREVSRRAGGLVHVRAARFVALALIGSMAAACGGGAEPRAVPAGGATPELPWEFALLGPPPHPADNVPSEERRVLGRALFYDPILSADRATACVTCHSEDWGLGDRLPRSVGIEGTGAIGPGRVGARMTRRNSPALWNVAYKERLFWDGRVDSLEAQALRPLESPVELARGADELIADLRGIAAYEPLFRAAFPDDEQPITKPNLGRALASFVRAYVSDRAPYDLYLRGDADALDAADLRGMALFAELGCADCHTPPRFESERYADRHVPALEAIEDHGRFEATGWQGDRGLFRVPTLRNARETAPFFHNGSVATFEEAVRHELAEQAALGIAAELSADELEDLLGFLRGALSDTSREQHAPESVPSGLPLPLDG
jgi:cytochrome c peroxidase